MTLQRFSSAVILVGVFNLLMAVSAFGQGGPFLARVWDSDIQLPPGGYRAARPIELRKSFNITTTPWTLIDGVTFRGADSAQNWHLNGTIMQRVNLSGQLGVGLSATNSIFENCALDKTGAWFVSMWGSHWRFENCIFTEKFMRGDLPVHDYEVHADHCTFYDVKLPTIIFMDDPADYLQKDKMGFVKCRFVRCTVPETFLAATVDCVFEDCEFSSKRAAWPKDTGPVSVNAMYAGLTDAPESFLNGPLSVKFSEAPAKPDAGTTLQHSQVGGGVTLANYQAPLQYANLGCVDGVSSQLVPAAGAQHGGAAAASPANAGADIHSFEDLVHGLPQNINLLNQDQPDLDGITAAGKWLNDHFAGHGVAMTIQYAGAQAVVGGYRVFGQDQSVLFGGSTLDGRLVSLFSVQSAASLAQVARGANVTVHGILQNVQIQGQGRGRNLVLIVTVAQAALQ